MSVLSVCIVAGVPQRVICIKLGCTRSSTYWSLHWETELYFSGVATLKTGQDACHHSNRMDYKPHVGSCTRQVVFPGVLNYSYATSISMSVDLSCVVQSP